MRSMPVTPAADVPLAPLSTLGVGGAARWFVRATTLEAVAGADRWARDRGVPLIVLGGGSNIVVGDDGVDGLVLQVGIGGVMHGAAGDGALVHAGAGEPWDRVVDYTVSRGWSGLECLSGIPGSCGGTPIQNVGAYGQDVADTLTQVFAYDRTAAEMVTLSAAACQFGYRSSRFKGADIDRFIVCAATFAVSASPPVVRYPELQAYLDRAGGEGAVAGVRRAVLAIRRGKGMVLDPDDPDTRSVGSFFVNPTVPLDQYEAVAGRAGSRPPSYAAGDGHVKVPAAWLIERAGWRRGDGDGRVGLSTKHPLAIVNRGGATAAEVVRFAASIKRRVGERFGVWLRAEPVFLGLASNSDCAFLRKADG